MTVNANISKVIIELFRSFMGLDTEQVVLYNQDWKIPADQRLYLSVGFLSERPYGSSRGYQNSDDGKALLEVLELHSQEVYSVNVYSFGPEALARKEEVLLAFHSTQAEQLMETYSFKLPNLPLSFTDVSQVEGAARLNRYQITFAVLRTRSRTNVVQYYDKFSDPSLLINP